MTEAPPDYETMGLKIPPHAADAEEALIAAVLRNPDCIHDITEITSSADFFSPQNRIIFSAMESLASRGEPIDAVTVWEAFSDDRHSEECRDHLFAIHGDPVGSGFPKAYANAIYTKARERELIQAGSHIADLGFGDGELDEKIAQAQDAVMRIGETQAEGLVHSNQALKTWVETIETRFKSKGEFTGLPTGFKDIDVRTHGLQDSDLIIIAGRPSQGKTTYAMNIAEYAAVFKRKPVLFFSMEMGVNQLYDKLNSSISGIDLNRIRRGTFQDDDWPKVSAAVSKVKDSPLYIDGRASLHINQIQATARRLHRKQPLSLIVVDYIQLGRGEGHNREQEISSISRGLKGIAKDLGIPVIGISQLSRKCEERQNKRPILSDLRESGAIEQDADIIQFVYRDEYYNENSVYAGMCEIITAKYRNGEIGRDYLTSRLHISRFDDFIGEIPVEERPLRKVSGFND